MEYNKLSRQTVEEIIAAKTLQFLLPGDAYDFSKELIHLLRDELKILVVHESSTNAVQE